MIPIEKNTERIDWNAVKADYIAGATYGVLSKRYGLNKGVIFRIAKKENWDELRERTRNAVETETMKRVAETAADNAALAASIKRQGLEILAKLFADFAKINATEHRESSQGVTDVKRLRDLTAAYKDLTDGLTETGPDKNAPIYDLLRKLDGECDV